MAGKIWNRLIKGLLFAAVILAMLLYAPKVIGIEPLIVLSGSMEPTYTVGSLVYVQQKKPEMMKKGDVMTFYLNKDTVVTHRIVSVNEKERQFITKGDANEKEDGSPVAFQNCIGTPRWSVPKLGYVAEFLGKTSGKIIYITGIFVLLLLLYMGELIWPQDEGEVKNENR